MYYYHSYKKGMLATLFPTILYSIGILDELNPFVALVVYRLGLGAASVADEPRCLFHGRG